MPFALLIIGAVMLVSSVRNSQGDLFALAKNDLTGPNNYIYWMVSILIIGSLGYIPRFKPLSVAFLTLVVIVLFLTKGNPNGIGGGFFSQFTKQLATTQTVPKTAPATTAKNTTSNNVLSFPAFDFSSLTLQ